MNTTKSQAAKRLFKKLSALRATLSNKERAILDNLIAVNEVSTHEMDGEAVRRAKLRVVYDENAEEYKIQD